VLTDLEVACKATLSFKNILRPLFRACLDHFREDYKATPMATLESSLWLLWRRPLALSTKNILRVFKYMLTALHGGFGGLCRVANFQGGIVGSLILPLCSLDFNEARDDGVRGCSGIS